jgi:predicted nucleic acid-binding protein
MIRAVIDTSILIRSVLKPRGSTGPILELVKAGRFRLLYSAPLLEELADVLSRTRFRDKYGVAAADVANVLTLLVSEGKRSFQPFPLKRAETPKTTKYWRQLSPARQM